MRSKIALRLTVYFAFALLLLAVIIGVLFLTIYRTSLMNTQKDDLRARAEHIAQTASELMDTVGPDRQGAGQGGAPAAGGLGRLGGYLRFVDDVAGTNVWLVDSDLNLITAGAPDAPAYRYDDLPEDAELVVAEALGGQTTFSEGFSSVLSAPTLTVATPITNDDDVIGAVLLHTSVTGLTQPVQQGLVILAVSILAALVAAVVLSILLAVRFTRPLKKMTDSTAQLAAGDYTAKTNVRQDDEIGALARSIDALSDKLDDARTQSEKLTELRRDFVANVSHELRTPVTVLRGSLEALVDGVVTEPEQVRDYHAQMLSETLVLQRLVTDLLDLSRLQNTAFQIERQELNLTDVLGEALRSVSVMAGDKNVKLDHEFDMPVFLYAGDYGRLRQMFLIVLDNAVKFSPSGGHVVVTLKDRAVSISDNGPGIPPEDIPHIFERFYKAKSEENRNGSGLGLAIARQIADRHGMTIDIDSSTNGTTFRFTL